MKKLFCVAMFSVAVLTVGTLRADESLRRVQQSLRDQGFYYGPVDGSPGDETTQAVRRYQIRNGLPVTGQLDDETKRTVAKTGGEVAPASGGQGGSIRPTVKPVPSPATLSRATPAPSRAITGDSSAADSAYQRPMVRAVPQETRRETPRPPVEDDENDQPPAVSSRGTYPNPGRPGTYSRPDLRATPDDDGRPPGGPGGPLPRNAVPPSARLTALFTSTPYEFAPPPVQADVLRRAQGMLARAGFYDGPLNGAPGPALAEALADYQDVHRLRRTERLDVATLGSLRLLPGRQNLSPRGRDDDDGRQGDPGIIFEGRIVR